MKRKTYKKMSDLAKEFGRPAERGVLGEVKAQLTVEIVKIIEKRKLTHQKVADLSSVPRSAVTGIVNGSLQKVTVDRLIRILSALGKAVDIKIKKAACIS